jgi:dipeptidyl aminopeptidase/acylaminoacyl peptidase
MKMPSQPTKSILRAAWFALSALSALSAISLSATAQYLQPAANLVVENIPPIPADLPGKLSAYTEFKPSAIVAWHPRDGSILVRKRVSNTLQLQRVKAPGAEPEPLTDFPDAIAGASFQPGKGEYILFRKATGGDEVFRIFRLDLPGKAVTPVSAEGERAGAPAWNRHGTRIVYTTVSTDRNNRGEGAARVATTRVYLADPLKPESARMIASFPGGGIANLRFSPDQKQLAYLEEISANESHLWLMNIDGSGQRRIDAERKPGEAMVAYDSPRFARDGKSLYATSDRGSEFKRLVQIDLASGKETVLTPLIAHDVDEFTVSVAAGRIAITSNEDGSSVLRFIDLATHQELPRPALLSGEISSLRWRGSDDADGSDGAEAKPGEAELAFNLTSSRSPGDVYSYRLASTKMTRWTSGSSAGLNALELVEPKLVRWKSFDGLDISGFVYQPDAKKFPGKRPVIINIHGGPEGQARPGFIGRNNYMVNELGIAIIYPNVRGSTGFGKTFLALDNGKLREDSVKDIGALLDWLKDRPDLDAARALVSGGSYGGYMSLAVSTFYPERIAGSIDVVGISNWVTFLTNTESYRRDLRRVEYGDERDPEMRKFLEAISPLTNAQKIAKPLFVVQGRNDPRVPYTESLQIVEKVRKQGVPVWFLMANDEGHGFAKKSNQDFLFYAQLKFIEQTLLK